MYKFVKHFIRFPKEAEHSLFLYIQFHFKSNLKSGRIFKGICELKNYPQYFAFLKTNGKTNSPLIIKISSFFRYSENNLKIYL